MSERVLVGDVADVLPTLEAGSFDAVLSDPPYGLSFMGKHWDHGVPSREVWEAVERTLKPGAHLMAFGGTRTFHRLAVAIEDAGFEIRDCLSWLYGQGFPKSLDISKALDKADGFWRGRAGAVTIQEQVAKGTEYERTEKGDPVTAAAAAWSGYGTALKPAWEPCILAMKPTCGTFAENAIRWGVAGLNVDGGRIGIDESERAVINNRSGGQLAANEWQGPGVARDIGERFTSHTLGRFPANVILDEESARALDEAVGERKAGNSVRGDEPSIPAMYDGGLKRVAFSSHGDTGGPSRFFYVSKASRREREAGLREAGLREAGGIRSNAPRESEEAKNPRVLNPHPTVKPLALCEYLARLILPPKRDTPRRLLVPFSGSGSEMIGALLAGWDEVVGIEREAEYAQIAEARLAWWTTRGDWRAELERMAAEESSRSQKPQRFGPLFDQESDEATA